MISNHGQHRYAKLHDAISITTDVKTDLGKNGRLGNKIVVDDEIPKI